MMGKELVETWQINSRIVLYLLDAVPEENLSDCLTSKGRDVGRQFAHINNVRLMWLKEAAPESMERVTKIDAAIDKRSLRDCLTRSGDAIGDLISNAVGTGGRVKGFKPHATAFVAYLIAHEAHHRAQIILAMKQSKHPLDKKTLYGIWEFGVR